MAVERKVADLYSRVVQARREGFLLSERTRSGRVEPPRSIQRIASDEGSGSTRIPRLRSRLGSMGSVANLVMRKNSTLSDADMLHLERHGRAVEESGGRLDILNTFRGPALQNFMRDGASSRALVGILALDRAVGATVADESRVGNFSRGDEAYFWQKLGRALPGVLDYTLACCKEERAQLAAALTRVAAFDHHRRAVGARPIAVAIVEPIDWASLLRYSIFASRRDLNVLRGVVDGMVRADPRLRREAENVRAPIRVATRIQRAWRARRLKGDASASSP